MVMVYFLVEQKLIFRERLNEFFFLMCDVPDAVILVPLFHITLADWIGITGFNMFGIHVRQGRRQEFIFLLLRGANHINLYKNLIKFQIYNAKLGTIGEAPAPPSYAPAPNLVRV